MNANSFSARRLVNLFRFEFLMHHRFYVIGILGMFLAIVTLFLLIFFVNRYNTWAQSQFTALFYTELFFLVIFGVGYSFVELRDKRSSQTYLSLPGLASEKYTVQFLTRILLFPGIFVGLYILGVSVAKDLFHMSSTTTVYIGDNPTPIVTDDLDVWQMLFVFNSWDKPWMSYFLIFGTAALLVSLMFSGGIIFGKWNALLMPLTTLGFCALMLSTPIVLSWIVVGIPEDRSMLFTPQMHFRKPELFENAPLLPSAVAVLIWLATIFFFWIAYMKLKEREV